MNENSEKSRGGVTARQWLTLGLLAAIFVGVLVFEFGKAGASSQPPASTTGLPGNPRRPAVASATTASSAASGQKTPKPDHPWPSFPLAKVLEFDPFATPASLASLPGDVQPVEKTEKAAEQKSEAAEKDRVKQKEEAEKDRARRQRALTQLQKEVVRTVVGTDHGFAAIVGTRTVHVGDRLHGFRVKAIQPDGVILEETHD